MRLPNWAFDVTIFRLFIINMSFVWGSNGLYFWYQALANWHEDFRCFPASVFEHQFFLGPVTLTLSEQQHFVWDNASQSTKRRGILEIWERMAPLPPLVTPMLDMWDQTFFVCRHKGSGGCAGISGRSSSLRAENHRTIPSRQFETRQQRRGRAGLPGGRR